MVFTLSTFITHILLCSVVLLLNWLFLYRSVMLSRIGFIAIFISSAIIMLRLMLPFEWSFTRTIPVSGIYPDIFNLLNRPVFVSPYEISLYQAIIAIASIISVMRLGYLMVRHHSYMMYVRSLKIDHYVSIKDEKQNEKRIPIVIDPAANNAVVVGLRNATIVMPDLDLSEGERDYILLHELSHIKTHDALFKYLSEIFCAIHWWFPFAYLLKRQLTSAIELRADHNVTKTLNEREKIAYAECLLKIAKHAVDSKTTFALGHANIKHASMKSRFENILSGKRSAIGIAAYSLFVAALLCVSLLFVFEPYAVSVDVEEGTFVVENDDSYIVRSNDKYELYVGGVFVAEINDIGLLPNLVIYDSIEEAIQ